MIEPAAFASELSQLADRFNRSVSDDMARRYHEFLAPQMDTPQFLQAARAIYNHDAFWPAPVRFLEAINLDPASEANAAWELALMEARKGVAQPLDQYVPAHAAALTAVGKNRAIGQTHEDRLPFLKREFIAAYRQHRERATPELTKGDADARTLDLDTSYR